jgi:hypothetical protein
MADVQGDQARALELLGDADNPSKVVDGPGIEMEAFVIDLAGLKLRGK